MPRDGLRLTPVSALPLRVATKSLQWIHSQIRYFDPFSDCELSDDLRHKALAELALLCLIFRRHPELGSLRETNAIVSFIAQLSTTPFFEASLCRWNDAIIPVLILTVMLDAYGVARTIATREMICRVIHGSNIGIIERIPYRQLELRHILDAGGFEHNLPSYRDLWSRTLLANSPNLMFLSDSDVYSLTHTVFYLTDFGARKIEFLLTSEAERVHNTISCLLGVYLRQQNWDIAAELLLAEKCIGRTSRYSVVAWKRLMAAQLPDGRFEGPQLDASANRSSDPKQVFEDSYHTTLVCALTGAVWDSKAVERPV